MFTGLITDIGVIDDVREGRDARTFRIVSTYAPDTIEIGASISHDGCCLTVVEKGAHGAGAWHDVEVSEESLSRTTLGHWIKDRRVNLERSLRAGDELGGHFVAGHVDGVGRLLERRDAGGSVVLAIAAPDEMARFIAEKGSIAVNGVSLTVNAVERANFEVNIIPHTGEATNLGALKNGEEVNLEADLIARYLARMADLR